MAAELPEILKIRFFERFVKGEGCWEWTAARITAGYGSIRCERKHFYAHRLSYQINVGPIPKGIHVLHSCDNPPCVRPDHLFLGTHQDNMDDMNAKGRNPGGIRPCGENNSSSKLTDEMVRYIRAHGRMQVYGNQCIIDRGNLVAMAKEFGVAYSTIVRVFHGQRWKHVS